MTGPTAGWHVDPLDERLLRYWDGRWTFHTRDRPQAAPPPEPAPQAHTGPVLRPDIAQAAQRVQGVLLGSRKELGLLAGHLEPEERVLALTGAVGEGTGVLACTNLRVLFLFEGLVRRQFVHVRWNDTKSVVYDRRQHTFAVHVRTPARRTLPALSVHVYNLADAQALVHAAQTASAAPRLDVV
ncbi:hypothetical protein JOF53_006647 [Crossiella equi]|uniref:DUF2510 domain-containing protein n=1 Tax=Crossiella equi TaxID=130796 RepID=A0ABS5AQ18_9PSEU|nr:DUF2510 domain-containing protein [Crossiella equi]MBP2477775.1 hypothetical protein [Crossiella equi]